MRAVHKIRVSVQFSIQSEVVVVYLAPKLNWYREVCCVTMYYIVVAVVLLICKAYGTDLLFI